VLDLFFWCSQEYVIKKNKKNIVFQKKCGSIEVMSTSTFDNLSASSCNTDGERGPLPIPEGFKNTAKNITSSVQSFAGFLLKENDRRIKEEREKNTLREIPLRLQSEISEEQQSLLNKLKSSFEDAENKEQFVLDALGKHKNVFSDACCNFLLAEGNKLGLPFSTMAVHREHTLHMSALRGNRTWVQDNEDNPEQVRSNAHEDMLHCTEVDACNLVLENELYPTRS
jgi:hypothetical protein